jgi:hypothetical protein
MHSFSCSECGRIFTGRDRHGTQANLKRHVRMRHSRDALLSCDFCDAKMATRQQLQRHVAAKHAAAALEGQLNAAAATDAAKRQRQQPRRADAPRAADGGALPALGADDEATLEAMFSGVSPVANAPQAFGGVFPSAVAATVVAPLRALTARSTGGGESSARTSRTATPSQRPNRSESAGVPPRSGRGGAREGSADAAEADESFASESADTPQTEPAPARVQCPYCASTYKLATSLRYHILQAHPERAAESDRRRRSTTSQSQTRTASVASMQREDSGGAAACAAGHPVLDLGPRPCDGASAAHATGDGGGVVNDADAAPPSTPHPRGRVAAGGAGLRRDCPHCGATLSSMAKLRRHMQRSCSLRKLAATHFRNHVSGDHFGGGSGSDSNSDADDAQAVPRAALPGAPASDPAIAERRRLARAAELLLPALEDETPIGDDEVLLLALQARVQRCINEHRVAAQRRSRDDTEAAAAGPAPEAPAPSATAGNTAVASGAAPLAFLAASKTPRAADAEAKRRCESGGEFAVPARRVRFYTCPAFGCLGGAYTTLDALKRHCTRMHPEMALPLPATAHRDEDDDVDALGTPATTPPAAGTPPLSLEPVTAWSRVTLPPGRDYGF